MKYILSASVLALALAILIYALMARYYLIVAPGGGGNSPLALVQIGPFATQAGCESARNRIPDAMFGNSDLNEKANEKGSKAMSQFMVCVSSR